MDLSLALILKIVGGLFVTLAHRTIARAARAESFSWWLTAMFVPGGSIFYGLRRAREFARVLLVLLVGFATVGGGFALGVYQRLQEAKVTAQHESATEPDDDGDADDEKELPAGRYATEVPASPAKAVPAVSVAPAAAQPATTPAAAISTMAAVSSNSAPAPLPAATSVPKYLQPQLKKLQHRYEELAADRAHLDAKNADAVRKFNLRAEDYEAACRNFRAALAER